MKRTVITGIGVVSCLGNNQEEVYQSLLNSKSGITFSEEYKEYNLKSNIHGIPNIKLEDHVDRKVIRFMGPGSAYNYISMAEAIKDSGLEEKEVSNILTGMIMGSGGPSIQNVIFAADKTREKNPKKMGPFIVPRTMSSTASATLAVPFKIKGVNYTISSACATSGHCIGNGMELIQLGKQKIIFAGGSDEVHFALTAMFDAMTALSSKYNDTPEKASRPYDKTRDGFVISGGGGVLVLEEYEHAKARGAKIYAELTGYGATSDGYDMVAPSGEGAVRCMQMALSTSKNKIDYINTHGTSTPVGDITELKAVGEMLDENPYLSDLAGDTPGTNSIEIDTRDFMDEDVIAPETLNEILGVHDTAAYDRLSYSGNQSPMRGFGTNWEKHLEPDQVLTDDDFRAGLEGIMDGPPSTSKGYGKAVAEGAATGAVLGSTSAYLFPEEVKKVVGGLAELKDSWWTWIKDFPDHLDWVARATGATLDGMEKATRSTGNQVVDLLNDGFRQQTNSLLTDLNGGVIPMMGKADAAILQGASKDLSRQGYDGQAVFSNDIRKEIEAGDAMVVGYRTEKDYERALEQAGQYGLEIDRHYWRKPSRKNIRPGTGEPWTRDHLKKLATTNHFYPDAGLRRGPR